MPSATNSTKLNAFHLSCWLLALVALIQLAAIGTALALGKSRTQVVERVIEKPVAVMTPRPVVATPPAPSTPDTESTKIKTPMEVTEVRPIVLPRSPAAMIPANVGDFPPPIADPLVEKLINEARDARIQGDNMRAVLKLEEASKTVPNDANLLYEFASVHEAMGVYDQASNYYLRVYELGQLKAGSLWKKAGAKLERGIIQDPKGLLNIGVCRTIDPRKTENGTIHGILAPISMAPGHDLDPLKVSINVHFYEKNDGKVTPAIIPDDGQHDGNRWLTTPVDWSDGEELVELWYLIPHANAQDRHLFNDPELLRLHHGGFLRGKIGRYEVQPAHIDERGESPSGAKPV